MKCFYKILYLIFLLTNVKAIIIDTSSRYYRGFTVRWFSKGTQGMIIRMAIGTPKAYFSIQIRLDGRYLYVFDEKCLSTDRCGNMFNRQVYNRRLSSTSKDLSLPMQVSDTAMGYVIEDEISIEHYITLRHQFGSAYKSTIRYHASDGVLGLQQGPNVQSPFNNLLRYVSGQQFTILTERVDDTEQKRVLRRPGNMGYITFGEMDVVNCGRDYTVATSVNSSTWNFRLNRVLIGNFVDQTEYVATVDPTEAFTLVPRLVMLQILTLFKAKPIPSNITTYTIRNAAELPTIYIDVGGYQLVWEPQNFVMGKTLAIMMNPRDGVLGAPSWVFGNTFLKQYCATFSSNQLVFTRNIWTEDTIQNQNSAGIVMVFRCMTVIWIVILKLM